MNIELRGVTDDDRDFLFDLRWRTMGEYIEEAWGWDDEWQRLDFETRFNPGEQQLILMDGTPVGFLHVETKPNELYIADIQIHPAYQNRGIGAIVIRRILEQGRAAGVIVTLQVLQVNARARRLYERLGFRAIGEAPHYILMRADL